MTTIGSLPNTGQPVRLPEPPKRGGNTSAKGPAPFDSNSDASIWRDTKLRYGGYADEIGEFISPYLGGLGKFIGYLIASIYCMADLGTTIPKKYANAPADLSTGKKTKSAAAETADLSFFHLVATLLVPPRLIGMAVHSAERVLDKEVLKDAQKALEAEEDNLKKSGSAFKKMTHAFSKMKLDGEEALSKLISPRMEDMIEHQGTKSGGFMSSVQGKVNGLIERFGPGLGKIVNGTAFLAKKYNDHMRFEMFKDTEMPDTLKKNAEFLKKKGKLNQHEVAKLVLMKPWPVLVGIGMVPLIAHPFDQLTVKVMDWTIRPLLGKNKIVRDENGKLKSIHNPTFWGTPKAEPSPKASAPQSQLPWSNPQPGQPLSFAPQPPMSLNAQPMPPTGFGPVYSPNTFLIPAPPSSPFTPMSGLPNAPLMNRPAVSASPFMVQNQQAFPPIGVLPNLYGPSV
jgi:hypothetical protein